MKKITVLSKQGYKFMTDGVQLFDGTVANAMEKIDLWHQMSQSFMREENGIKFFISIGYNARYFKTDGQRYCTHLHIQTPKGCYLYSCLCSWTQKEIDEHVNRFIKKVDQLIDEKFDFEKDLQEKSKTYPWQTSLIQA